MDIETTFFRPIPVHLQNGGAEATLFRSIPIQSDMVAGFIPAHTRSLIRVTVNASFPAHCRSRKAGDRSSATFFRPISVHSSVIFLYLCTSKLINTGTYMAGTVKDMSQGETNYGSSKKTKQSRRRHKCIM